MLDISRNNDKIICNDSIKAAITKWMKNRYYEFDDFSRIIDEIGLKTPITLEKLDVNDEDSENTFKCTTYNTDEVFISIRFPNIIEVIVNTENKKEIFYYDFLYNYNCSGQQIIKKGNKKIITDTKTITTFYDLYGGSWLLEFGSSNLLLIIHNSNDSNMKIFNTSSIEEYLLTLNNKIDILMVLHKLVEITKLSKKDLSNLEEILIQYDSNKIVLKYGEIIEYQFHDIKTHEYFYVFKDGSWNYNSKTLNISFHDNFNFNFSGQENFIKDFSPKEALLSIKKKMQPFFNLLNQSYSEITNTKSLE